jgi:hypothetical protein
VKEPDETHPTLVVEYKLDGWGSKSDLAKRHALEDALDRTLKKARLGLCDGGEIGAGSMEVFCPVFDYAKAKAAIVAVLARPEFSGRKRVYRIPGDEPRKGKARTAGFTPGDCLAVRLSPRRYTAAYVAATDDKSGQNVVVDLDYLERCKPKLADFARMKPLRLTHHSWNGRLSVLAVPRRTKEVDAVAEVVGNRRLKLAGIDIEHVGEGTFVNHKAKVDRWTRENMGQEDPDAGKYVSYGAWSLGDHVVRQRKWDARGKK